MHTAVDIPETRGVPVYQTIFYLARRVLCGFPSINPFETVVHLRGVAHWLQSAHFWKWSLLSSLVFS